MATVCGSSLALMDAGVPLKRPTAGIAMGLILEDKRYAVLSDILGDEDHLGDMDFKVAGTERGVTSLQMDIKIAGITEEIMRVALGQAKDGRLHILGEMAKALTSARAELGEHAPRIEVFSIPTDKIREVIGTGGKVIREIVEKTGAKIDISDDGTVKVASANGDAMKAAINWIKSIASEPEIGHIYEGTVVKVMDFGAFVNFFGAKDGLVHISQLAPRRVQKVTDVVKEGDKVKVKLLGFDERGKVAPLDEGRRPGDRRGSRSQAEGRGRATAAGRRAAGGGRRGVGPSDANSKRRPPDRLFVFASGAAARVQTADRACTAALGSNQLAAIAATPSGTSQQVQAAPAYTCSNGTPTEIAANVTSRSQTAPDATAAIASMKRAWRATSPRRIADTAKASRASQTRPCVNNPARAVAEASLANATGNAVRPPITTATAAMRPNARWMPRRGRANAAIGMRMSAAPDAIMCSGKASGSRCSTAKSS